MCTYKEYVTCKHVNLSSPLSPSPVAWVENAAVVLKETDDDDDDDDVLFHKDRKKGSWYSLA